MEEINKTKLKNFGWIPHFFIDPTLFPFYVQEKIKYTSLKLELFTIAKLALQIREHDPKDCGMRSDFKIYIGKYSDNFHVAI